MQNKCCHDRIDVENSMKDFFQIFSAAVYGMPLSHIFEIPSISNEKPSSFTKIPKYQVSRSKALDFD